MAQIQVDKIENDVFEVKKHGNMNVPLRIFASEKLLKKMQEDSSIQQGVNVAGMPGIQKYSIMLSDAHIGYGFSIGGVAAFDSETGCITPGGIGFDINCGVRLLTTNLTEKQVRPKLKQLLDVLFRNIPPGVGGESLFKLSDEELDDVLTNGMKWALKKGYARQKDLDHCEEKGTMPGADSRKVSPRAKSRGRKQLGTLGAGNHFLEVQTVGQIINKQAADKMGITRQGQVLVMIHTGSRGLGHQVCSDYLRRMEDTYPEIMEKLPEKDLIYAPIKSELGKDYYGAMCAAANFAWTNRQIITHQIRKSFHEVFGEFCTPEDIGMVYDVAHNIAKLEEHDVSGKMKKVYTHRKGATRAFPPGHPAIPEDYKDIGQPVMIPGSMGTASYILVGTQKAMKLTFGSSVHGAGRVMSRMKAKQEFRGEDVKQELEKRDILIKAATMKGISEEAPKVYKDVDEVVKVSHDLGISRLVAKLLPIGVVKG
ncbi:RtcB family protein [Candidatus Woesearchaeota archaeon]|nr:RtcB family protein [Candidatus Woesearchaeota archaeon]